MAIYAISDLHLALGVDKPMDVFGGRWEGYMEKLKMNWLKEVGEDDSVIIPGDISWAMYLKESLADFSFLQNLPGKKYISKGNHDYWWTTLNKLKLFVSENNFSSIHFLHNNHFNDQGIAICGTRGWVCPEDEGFSAEDEKVYNREIQRLEISLLSAKNSGEENIIVAMHYPPFNHKHQNSRFVEIMERYNVKYCVYGHLHGEGRRHAFEGKLGEINYKLISADHLAFKPLRIDPEKFL